MASPLEKQFEDIMKDYRKTLRGNIEEALTDMGNMAIDELSKASPLDPESSGPHLKDSWKMKTRYTGVRYVGNTKTNQNGVPLTNLLEYGSKGKPFIARTFESVKDRLYRHFLKKVQK